MNTEIITQPAHEKDILVAQVYKTSHYEKFKFLSANRQTDHVNALALSFKERLVPNAILCNEKYEIIDGQNRFLAAKELGLPIFYYCINGLDIYDVAYLNSYAKNWGNLDFMRMWSDLGKEEYTRALAFNDDYPDFGITNILMILGDSSAGERQGNYLDSHALAGKSCRNRIKDGSFRIKDIGHAHFVANSILAYKPYCRPGLQVYKQNAFCSAMVQLLRKDNFDNAEMVRKASMFPSMFYRCNTAKEYIVMLENLWNYKRRNKTHFEY